MSHIEQKALAAGKTLEHLGYNWQGGELWKPPLGANPIPLLDRITELEAQLADAKQVANDCRIVADNAIVESKKSQWQPMETAPKLGEYQVYMPNEKTKIQTAKARESFTVIGSSFAFDLTAPTHWMPLPKPPSMQPKEQS